MIGKTLYDSNGQQFYPYSNANYVYTNIVPTSSTLAEDLTAIYNRIKNVESQVSGEQTINGQLQVDVYYRNSTESTKANIIAEENAGIINEWSADMTLPNSSTPYCWKRTRYYWNVGSTTSTPFRTDYEICATALYPETQIMYTAILQINNGLQGPVDYGEEVEDGLHIKDTNNETIKWYNYFPGLDANKIYGYMATRHRDAGQNWPEGWHVSLFAQYPIASSTTTK